jgi:hypothetical protein
MIPHLGNCGGLMMESLIEGEIGRMHVGARSNKSGTDDGHSRASD